MAIESETIYSGDKDYWESYRKGRPYFPDSFFERIFKYHAENGGKFDLVHDAGAGGGVHSARLAERFNKVLVTDDSPSNIATAKLHLLGPKYEFRAAKLEDTVDLEPGSVDMVYASTMLHYTDIPRALEAVGHQLRPGGSFAVPCSGQCIFKDPGLQQRFTSLFNTGANEAVEKFGDWLLPLLELNASGYDSVALPQTYFRPDSIRLKLNDLPDATLGYGIFYEMLVPPELREKSPIVSRVSHNEEVIFEADDDWRFEGDTSMVRSMIASFPFDLETSEMERLWKEVEDYIDGRPVEGHWVIHLLLATRR